MVKFEDLFGDDSNTEFEFNEHGDLELVEDADEETDSDESVDSENEEADESEETDAEDSDDSEASDGDDADSGSSDNPVEARIKSLESTVDKLLDVVEKLAKVKPEQPQQPQEEEDNDDEDFDPRKFKSSLKKMIEETIDKKVKPIEDQSVQQREAAVVSDLSRKHGDAFKAGVPFMKELLTANPSMGIQKAWEAYQRTQPAKATPKATKPDGGGKTVTKKTGDAASLRKKAANLETPKGANSGTQKAEKRAGNLNDTIAEAWDEIFSK